MKKSFCFFTIGETAKSTNPTTSYKKYIGLAPSFVLGVNPNKAELEQIYGHAVANDPEYVSEHNDTKRARIDFIVRTDKDLCNGADILTKATIFLENAPAYNKDNTKVQVIDEFGYSTWASVEDVKAKKQLLASTGKPIKISTNYRMACKGEVALVEFLKNYLGIDEAFSYINGEWKLKRDDLSKYKIVLENVKDYFKGDFSELKQVLALRPDNKIKLLYAVTTTEKGQFQNVITRNGTTLRNNASAAAITNLEKNLSRSPIPNAVYKVSALEEYVPEATTFSESTAEMPQAEEDLLPWE